jgi:hypothetical protein
MKSQKTGSNGKMSPLPFLIVAAMVLLGLLAWQITHKLLNATEQQPVASSAKSIKPAFPDFEPDPLVPIGHRFAHQFIFRLAALHPDSQCRKDMTQWLGERKIRMQVSPDVYLLQTSMASESGKMNVSWPTLFIAEDYTRTTMVDNNDDILLEKQSDLYHEYVHFRNHFDGRYRLDNQIENQPIAQQAVYFWNTEYDTCLEEWGFLKRMQATRVRPGYQKAIQQKGEQLGFLDGFYSSLKKTYPSDKVGKYQEFWDKLYLEKARALAR